jgi:hypothetical protein
MANTETSRTFAHGIAGFETIHISAFENFTSLVAASVLDLKVHHDDSSK